MIRQMILSHTHLQKKGTDRTFPLNIDGTTIYINPNRLSRGNVKLHEVWIFDLSSGSVENGGSCHNCTDCQKDCYSRQQEIQYKDTRAFRLVNLYLLKFMPLVLREMIENQLQASTKPYKTLRIHSAGDFYGNEEIVFWNAIIKNHPEMKFYAYTKVDHLFNFDILTNHKNFNLISSLIEDDEGNRHLNFGDLDYIKNLAKKTNGFICPATMKETKGTVKCNKNCKYCINGNKPIFLIHGKGKNVAKKKVKKSA